jgi:uncharacterized membrane protein YvbJ
MTTVAACRTCGTEPLENARFCHNCGSPVNDGDTRAGINQEESNEDYRVRGTLRASGYIRSR